jgi:N-acetylmuramoyl-L-alanine amidase
VIFRSIVLITLLWSTLFGLSDTAQLKRAKKWVHYGTKSEQFRAYNDFKSLYLRALMDENKRLEYESLQGIVTSGKKLHIDVARYEELLQKSKKQVKSKSTYRKSFVKPHQKSSKKVSKTSLHTMRKLTKVYWSAGELILDFDAKLSTKSVNYFTLFDSKKKRYKYVFDIHASFNKKKSLYRKGIDGITIAQYKNGVVRLVIQNRKKLPIRFALREDKLAVKFPKKKVTTSAPSYIPTKYLQLSHQKVIVIDPGHGGKDPGAIGYKHYREKVVVLAIAKELKKILESRGYKVYMTRNGDRFIKLRNRTKYANRKKADLFVSIHANAVGGKKARDVYGIECYFLDKTRSAKAKRVAALENSADLSEMDFYGKESFLSTLNSHNIVASNKLAIDLQRGVLAKLRKHYKDVKDAGVRPAPFWVLVGAQMPAVLVEVGFITHPKEARRLVDKTYEKRLAQGLAEGIERYFINNN